MSKADPSHPGIATRVRARVRGERDAVELEALRSAGGRVYEALTEGEQVRTQLRLAGQTLWTASPAIGSRLVATWNAYVLQSLAAGLLDADYAADTGTVGYVPPVTFEQVWSWFAAAEGWLSEAEQAAANPDYDLTARVVIPAALPAWAGDGQPSPPEHLRAMLTVLGDLHTHADVAVYDLERQSSTEQQRHAVNRLRELAAEAASSAEYAQSLAGSAAGERLPEIVEVHVKRAVRLWFHIGQLAAMPQLVRRYRGGTGHSRIDPETLPGGSRFDPWCLTHPSARAEWSAQRQARQALDALWQADPDPLRTLTLFAQIQAALAAGQIERVPDSEPGTYYYACPWPPIYRVRRTVRLGGRRLSVPQQFTVDLRVTDDGRFARRILLGPFTATDELEYGGQAG